MGRTEYGVRLFPVTVGRTEYGAGRGGGQVRRRSYRVERGPCVACRGAPDDAVLVHQLVSQLSQSAMGCGCVSQVTKVNVSANGNWGQSRTGQADTRCRDASYVL